jgi:hypothetical protein
MSAAKNIEALNHALAGIPPERMRMHLCWGNYEGPHHHDVPLAEIIDVVFTARPATISFEAANPRHAHEWTLEGQDRTGHQLLDLIAYTLQVAGLEELGLVAAQARFDEQGAVFRLGTQRSEEEAFCWGQALAGLIAP